MAREQDAGNERPVYWIGSSKSDFLAFADPVRRKMGYALGVAQRGGKHLRAKHWKGEGPGVFEIVEDWDGDTFRAIYTVRFAEAVYVLHAFQKKSPSGVRTAGHDIELVRARMRRAQAERERRK